MIEVHDSPASPAGAAACRAGAAVFYASLLAVALLLPGCRSDRGEAPRGLATRPAAAAVPERDSPTATQPAEAPLRDVPLPPGIEPRALAPREGEALRRATMTLDEVLDTLPPPGFLTATQPAATQAADETDPVLAAQRAYIRGRQLWRDGDAFGAARELERADALAPQTPEILHLLGQIYTATGNRVRGGYYLEKAVALEPRDIESVFLLGRFALEQARWPVAIATLGHALRLRGQVRDVDAGLWWLLRFALGSALEREGYDEAAIEEYRAAVEMPDSMGTPTRMGRELSFLWAQRPAIWAAIGDAHHRLGRPRDALQAYERAAALDASPSLEVLTRRVYTLLRLNQPEPAQAAAAEYLRTSDASAGALELTRYLARQLPDAWLLADRLEEVYHQTGRPASLAVAIADLRGWQVGADFLRAHLTASPGDMEVFERLVERITAEGAASTPAALATVAEIIAADPASAAAYADRFLSKLNDAPALLAAWDALPDERRTPAARYLYGRALAKAGRPDDAVTALRAAMEGDERLVAARAALASLLAAQGQTAEAERLIADLPDSTDPELIALRVQILSDAGRTEEAIRLLDALVRRPDTDPKLIVRKAQLQQRAGDPNGAERTLLDALDARPREEALYEALFDLYESPAAPADRDQQAQLLMRRMMGTIPDSRIARLKRAEWMAMSRQFEQAERLARQLLEEEPDDARVLRLLVGLLQATDRRAEAAPLLERMLLLEPPSQARSQHLAVVYLRDGRPEDALKALAEAWSGKVEEPAQLVGLTTRALLALDRADEAERRIREAMKKFPEHRADLRYQLAMLYERRGDRARAEQLKLDILRDHPDHAMTNNALGYMWADAGKNLARAQRMIQTAVNQDPENAAYLDSLGWVFYKLGNFQDAVRWLRRAQTAPGGEYPVILSHLGDALFRLGRRDQAAEAWRRAQAQLADPDLSLEDDPELEGLAERLQARLDALAKNEAPPVADVPGPDEAEGEDAAAVPAPEPELLEGAIQEAPD